MKFQTSEQPSASWKLSAKSTPSGSVHTIRVSSTSISGDGFVVAQVKNPTLLSLVDVARPNRCAEDGGVEISF